MDECSQCPSSRPETTEETSDKQLPLHTLVSPKVWNGLGNKMIGEGVGSIQRPNVHLMFGISNISCLEKIRELVEEEMLVGSDADADMRLAKGK
jgi:hypothetical protein